MKKRLAIPALLLAPLTALAADEDLVEEKLELVLKELEAPAAPNWDIPDFLINFLRFISGLGLLYRIIFSLCVIALIAYILYKLVSLIVKDSNIIRSWKGPNPEERSETREGRIDYLSRARAYQAEGNDALAALELHKGSYDYLRRTKILDKGRDYTNRDVFRRLKSSDKLKPFREIAIASEQIVFGGLPLDSTRYGELEALYEKAFYGKE